LFYFVDDSLHFFPAEWQTGCSGVECVEGWRIRGDFVDSGYHFQSNVDSWLTLSIQVTSSFSALSFAYVDRTSYSQNGLQFFIDGRPVALGGIAEEDQHVEVPLSEGSHALTWNYHQEANTDAGSVMLRNVVITGATTGGNDVIQCPPGTYSSSPGSTECLQCPAGSYSALSGSTSCIECPVNYYNAEVGATSCTMCLSGSYTNGVGAVYCFTDCLFSDVTRSGKLVEYDLSALGGAMTGPIYDQDRTAYYISICNITSKSGVCPYQTHMCSVGQDGSASDWGSSVGFLPNHSDESSFSIQLEEGDSNGCGTNENRNVEIQFQCDTTAGIGSPSFVSDNNQNCSLTFTWTSILGCAVCQDSDYSTVTGTCSNGKRSVNMVRISDCNGPGVKTAKSEACASVEFPFFMVFVVLLVFLLLVGLAIGIFVKNRKITAEYVHLKEQHDNPIELDSPQ